MHMLADKRLTCAHRRTIGRPRVPRYAKQGAVEMIAETDRAMGMDTDTDMGAGARAGARTQACMRTVVDGQTDSRKLSCAHTRLAGSCRDCGGRHGFAQVPCGAASPRVRGHEEPVHW